MLGDRPRDWNKLNNPTSEIRACLASSEKKGEGGYAGEFLVLFHCKAHVVFRVKHHRHILFVIRGRIQRLNGEILARFLLNRKDCSTFVIKIRA